jgi:RNA polymerase sigma-B factor
VPAPTPPQSVDDLFRAFARTHTPDLRNQLVEAHLRLAQRLARRFDHRGEDHDDLVQVASAALVMAVDRFDPSRGVAFATFATRTISGELKRYFRDKGWALRVPRRIQELYLELTGVISELSQTLGRSPTVPELAAATGASEEAVLEAMEAGRGYRSASIDAAIGDGESPMVDHLGEDDLAFVRFEEQSILGPACARLPERERRIIYLRFAKSMTQTEIARELGISQMHVSRLLAASLGQLRQAFAESD